MKPAVWSAIPILFLSSIVECTHLKIKGSRRNSQAAKLRRRANIAGTSSLTNSQDTIYTTNITLAGQSFVVLIDTGSSDLWVASNNVPNSQSLGKSASVTYAVGQISGPIKSAQLTFAGHTIQDQAFIQVPPDSEDPLGSGLIGLGPNKGSNIYGKIQSKAGSSVVDRIFLQDTTTPNFISILLGRADDPTDTFPGDITVGEIVPGYEDVTSQPKLPVVRVPVTSAGDQHWQVLLDEDGITGPDGKTISITTRVSQTSNRKQATAVFDSGFSLPQVPKVVSDAFYQNVQGATTVNLTGLGQAWVIPCEQELNVSFKFAGKTYPIHPLDMSIDPVEIGLGQVKAGDGSAGCIGTFQPIALNSANYDMILGMAFMRNTYTLINYGDFIDGGSNRADPYVQLLSTSNDTSESHQDFVKVRLSGNDSTRNLNPSKSNGGDDDHDHKETYQIIAAAAAGFLFLFGAAVLLFAWLRKRRLRRGFIGKSATTAYHPLGEGATDASGAPAGQAYSMQQTQYYNHSQQSLNQPYDPFVQPQAQAPQYDPYRPSGTAPAAGQYQTPWGQR